MCEDPYIYSQPITIGGNETPGIFSADCPFSGDSYEFAIMNVSTFTGTGIVYVTATDMRTLPEANLIYGDLSTSPASFLPGYYYSVTPGTLLPATQFLRLPAGAKRIYMCCNTTSYVTIVFRMLPVKIIPARAMIYPDVAENQANVARADKAIERLELDIAKGDEATAARGKLQ